MFYLCSSFSTDCSIKSLSSSNSIPPSVTSENEHYLNMIEKLREEHLNNKIDLLQQMVRVKSEADLKIFKSHKQAKRTKTLFEFTKKKLYAAERKLNGAKIQLEMSKEKIREFEKRSRTDDYRTRNKNSVKRDFIKENKKSVSKGLPVLNIVGDQKIVGIRKIDLKKTKELLNRERDNYDQVQKQLLLALNDSEETDLKNRTNNRTFLKQKSAKPNSSIPVRKSTTMEFLSRPTKSSVKSYRSGYSQQSGKSFKSIQSVSTIKSNQSEYETLEILQQIRFDRLKMLKDRLAREFEEDKKQKLKDYKLKLVQNGPVFGSGTKIRNYQNIRSAIWQEAGMRRNKPGKIDFIKRNKMAVKNRLTQFR